MKKQMIFVMMCSLLMLSSCSTYTGQGAYMGASIGGLLGSAFGGYSGGWRGQQAGQLVGMATGAAVGAAVGAAEDKRQAERIEQYSAARARKAAARRARAARRASSAARSEEGLDGVYENGVVRPAKTSADDSGFDPTNSGDDRVDFGIKR